LAGGGFSERAAWALQVRSHVMGLLDQVLGGMGGGGGMGRRKPGLGSTVAAGVVLALLIKGVRSYEASHAAGGQAAGTPQGAGQGQGQVPGAGAGGGLGGMLGGLGGMLGGAGGLGGMLGSLGGAGALGGLIKQMQQRGYGQQVNSWVGDGENQPIAPHELEEALGPDTVKELEEQTGMPRQTLLSELSQELPQAVHEATPQGREPDDDELHKLTGIGA
jgi:uncharacterized protein YidB (DUF937 family)